MWFKVFGLLCREASAARESNRSQARARSSALRRRVNWLQVIRRAFFLYTLNCTNKILDLFEAGFKSFKQTLP